MQCPKCGRELKEGAEAFSCGPCGISVSKTVDKTVEPEGSIVEPSPEPEVVEKVEEAAPEEEDASEESEEAPKGEGGFLE